MHSYEQDRIYVAVVIDQLLTRNANDEAQLVLTARILARLKNEKNIADGTEPCPPGECEVRINFPDDDRRLGFAIRDLERLGFPGNDISRLDPDHPDFFSLVGKEIHVRMKIVADRPYWNLAWPRTALRGEELKNTATSLEGKIAAARR